MIFMDFWLSLLTGFVASGLTLLAFGLIKPRIKIAKKISCHIKEDDKFEFQIKFINKSLFSLKNVDYWLTLIYEVDGDRNINDVSFKKDKFHIIKRYSKKNTDYAIKITTKGNLKLILDDAITRFGRGKAYLEFSVYAEHSLTSAGKIFTAKFKLDDIKYGVYGKGEALDFGSVVYSEEAIALANELTQNDETLDEILRISTDEDTITM